MLQGFPSNAALVQLKALEGILDGEIVDQQRGSELIQNLHARHIHTVRQRIAEIEREEIEVIVDVIGVAVELRIAANLEVASGVQQGPGGRRKADGAHVEVIEARALPREHVIDPRQGALAGGGIDAAQLAFQ